MITEQKFLLHISNAYNKYKEMYQIAQAPETQDAPGSDAPSPAKTEELIVSQWKKQYYNPLFILGKALRANNVHWNTNIRYISE